MSTVILRPVLWEVADVVEQIFRIAAELTCETRIPEMVTPREGLLLAITYFGSNKALADAIGFSQGALFRAKQLGWPTPLMATRIETTTCGKVRREWLRPDVFAPESQPTSVTSRNKWRGPKRIRRFTYSHSRRKP